VTVDCVPTSGGIEADHQREARSEELWVFEVHVVGVAVRVIDWVLTPNDGKTATEISQCGHSDFKTNSLLSISVSNAFQLTQLVVTLFTLIV